MPWFAACLDSALTWRGDKAIGCMVRAQVNEMGAFRLKLLAWQELYEQCPGTRESETPAR